MTRYSDWQRRLHETIEAASGRPFLYGRHDCCLFAADCIQAMTGSDPAEGWRGRYRSASGARRILRKHFGGSLAAGWTRTLGAPLASPLLAQRGDIAVVLNDETEATGVVDLTGRRVACLAPDGLTFVPLTLALSAWRV